MIKSFFFLFGLLLAKPTAAQNLDAVIFVATPDHEAAALWFNDEGNTSIVYKEWTVLVSMRPPAFSSYADDYDPSDDLEKTVVMAFKGKRSQRGAVRSCTTNGGVSALVRRQ